MSTSYVVPAQAFVHTLRVVTGFDPDYAAIVRGALSSNVDTTVFTPHAGLCVHIASTVAISQPYSRGPKQNYFEMGCAGAQFPPMFLWGGLYDPSNSNKGTPSDVASYLPSSTYPHGYMAVNPPSNPQRAVMPAVVSIPNYQFENTEYDTAQTYSPGDWLRAVTANNNANSGKLTNQNASGGAGFASSAAFAFGTDTVVGVVSQGTYTNADNVSVLSYFGHYVKGSR